MKPLVIYHGNCADGFGAAWAIWNKHPDWEFYPGVYGEEPPDVIDRQVILVDFSYSYHQLCLMGNVAKSILVLDHHKSAAEDLADFDTWALKELPHSGIAVVFDMNRSGAKLAWDFFHPDETAPPLLRHIEDRDLWKFELSGTKEISAALFSYEYDFNLWEHLMSVSTLVLIKEGTSILRKQNKDLLELLPQVRRAMNISDITVPVANLPYQFASEAGAMLSKGHPFAATYYDTEHERIFSLRSQDNQYNIDVSQIAKEYGGGGHRHSAGFKVGRGHELAKK